MGVFVQLLHDKKQTLFFIRSRRRGSHCLRRRSLAGELSLMPDLWSTDDHFVDKVSAVGQPTSRTQPPISLGSVEWVLITGVETIKTGRSELRMAVRSQVKVLWPRA